MDSAAEAGKGGDNGMKAGCGMVKAESPAKGRTMASDRGSLGSPLITPVTAMGIEHVRLSYLYLDQGDIDGYLSLLHSDITLLLPGEAEVRGRKRVATFQGRPEWLAADHLIHHVIGCGDRIAVEGRYVSRRSREGVDFTEVFALSEEGLLRSRKRYYFVAPR